MWAPQGLPLGSSESRGDNAPWIVCHAYEGSVCIYKEEQALPSAFVIRENEGTDLTGEGTICYNTHRLTIQ